MTVPTTSDRRSVDHRTVAGAPAPLDEFNRAGVLDPIDIHSALTVGRSFEETNPSVLLAAALTVRGTRFGHVCVDLPTVRQSVSVDGVPVEIVDSLPWPEPDAWLGSVNASPLNANGNPNRPLVVNGDLIYLQRYWAYETAVISDLKARIAAPRHQLDELAGPLARYFTGEASRQRLAAAMAATGRLTVIGGGPGTGKTHTIARLIGVLFEHAASSGRPPPVIAVAAPTGKAAARLTDQIRAFASTAEVPTSVKERLLGLEASTVHRLLGWHPQRGRFRHSASDPLPHDTVIVDEMSMVSLPMAAKLLDAVHPQARAVLVGDPDQLVSIEAGTVLGDLIGPAARTLMLSKPERSRLAVLTGGDIPGGSDHGGMGDHVVTLDRVFRFDSSSPVAELADAIRDGDADRAIAKLSAGGEGIQWHDTTDQSLEDLPEVTDQLIDHADTLIELGAAGDASGALAQLERLALLCAHRRGEVGVDHWVPWIESRSRSHTQLWAGGRWYPGRPVMVTTNDYRLGVFNGDIGVTVRDGDRMAVAFGSASGVRLIGPAQLPSSEPVHAMTIHKSQGSQFTRVIVLVPGEESRILTRELLYTAVTRARAEVIVVGAEAAIRAAINRQVTRASGLGRALWDKPSAHDGD